MTIYCFYNVLGPDLYLMEYLVLFLVESIGSSIFLKSRWPNYQTCNCVAKFLCSRTGGYIYLASDNAELKSISTPLFLDSSSPWKCVMFWYFIGIGYKAELRLFVMNSNTSSADRLWATERTTDRWTYVQMPVKQDLRSMKVHRLRTVTVVTKYTL